jgi:hypothetical protein
MMKRPGSFTKEAAEGLAIQALTFIAADPDRLGTFLSISGIGPDQIREAAETPGFLNGVLDHIAADESLLTGFAAEAGLTPPEVMRARAVLGGNHWEREVP